LCAPLNPLHVRLAPFTRLLQQVRPIVFARPVAKDTTRNHPLLRRVSRLKLNVLLLPRQHVILVIFTLLLQHLSLTVCVPSVALVSFKHHLWHLPAVPLRFSVHRLRLSVLLLPRRIGECLSQLAEIIQTPQQRPSPTLYALALLTRMQAVEQVLHLCAP
jgi:hypothetical protein